MVKYALTIILMVSIARAEDIYLRNGTVVRNARVVEANAQHVRFYFRKEIRTVSRDKVYRIEGNWDPQKTTFIEDRQGKQLPDIRPIRKERRNINYLPVALISLGLSWDFLAEANDIDKTIEGLPDGIEKDRLDGSQGRKRILGFTFLGIGVGALFYSFLEVPVYPTANGVALTIRF